MIKIFNEDCLITMKEHLDEHSIDLVITSPPYNTSKPTHTKSAMTNLQCRYDEYDDNKTNEEYCEWICNIFKGYDRVVKKDGVVLFNISYGNENPTVMFECVSDICKKTNWMIGDVIGWKKKSAIPNNVSSNKLTRIWEFVFVFCRQSEFYTYKANKKVLSVNEKTNQTIYSPIYNMIKAENNDGPNELNKATFSMDLVFQLLNIYATNGKDTVVYDSFMGTGTTAVACENLEMSCYGSEISKAQCDFANNRVKESQEIFFGIQQSLF